MSYVKDKTYEQYREYRLNKYKYEQGQIVVPVAVIATLAAIISLWEYIVIAITISFVIAIAALVIYWRLRKRVVVGKPIVITEDDAREGVTARITIQYKSSQAKLTLDIPPNVKNQQKFVVDDVLFEDKKGRKIKKKLYLVIEIQ